MADGVSCVRWRSGPRTPATWCTRASAALSALGAACNPSSSLNSDQVLYEGPNFYESESEETRQIPPLTSGLAAATDFLTALLQDGSAAPDCTLGPRVPDETPVQAGAVECPPLSRPAISSFNLAPDSTSNTSFGAEAAFAGGTFFYPDVATALTSDLSGDDWHISGTVDSVSGFGLFFSGCSRIDASAYGGIAFRLWGRLEPPGSLVFFIGSAAHQVSSTWLKAQQLAPSDADEPANLGRCIPLAQRYDNTCREPRIGLPVTETPTLVQVHWRDLVGGCPEASVNAAEVTSIAWYFPPSSEGYEVDLHLDDLRFTDLDVR
jgi:hypothetical protein